MARLILSSLAIVLLISHECLGNAREKRQSGRVRYPDDVGPAEKSSPSSSGCTSPNGVGDCRTPTACFFEFDSEFLEGLEGDCEEGQICCPRISARSSGESPIQITPRQSDDAGSFPSISADILAIAARSARDQLVGVDAKDRELESQNVVVRDGTAEAYHFGFFGNSLVARVIARSGLLATKASGELVKNFSLNSVQSRTGLLRFRLPTSQVQGSCPPEPVCPSSKYRTMNGSCNNLANPTWGQAFSAFQRLLPNAYADGFNSPRIATDRGPLPSARLVSTSVAIDRDNPTRRFTNLFQQYGQFVDHDITLAAITRTRNGSGILCCNLQNQTQRHEACFEIEIPSDDPFYRPFGQRCMNFVRTAPAPRPSCTFGPREQMNQLTSYIDGSQIYGSTDQEGEQLRTRRGGKLRSSTINGDEYLLQQNQTGGCAIPRTTPMNCFRAGDVRVNENVLLTTLQTVFLRMHNDVADQLAQINRGWTDEILYQEARRLVGAVLQHITYNEFLPLLLDRQTRFNFRLTPLFSGYYRGYDPSMNAASINSFAAAAYRLGHSMVPGQVQVLNRRGEVTEQEQLRNVFNNPERLYQREGLEGLIRGMLSQQSQIVDSAFTTELRDHLFEPRGAGFGLDLVSLNIQRGRDNGLPGYNDWREYCTGRRFTNFDQLRNVMNPRTASSLARLYRHIDDVDLFIGGVSEFPIRGSLLGPTFACIVAQQFTRYKHGDRFWYENGGMESSFTEAQLQEIRKISLARILCDYTDIDTIQPLVFIRPNRSWNPLLSCSDRRIPRINLSHWRNEPVWST